MWTSREVEVNDGRSRPGRGNVGSYSLCDERGSGDLRAGAVGVLPEQFATEQIEVEGDEGRWVRTVQRKSNYVEFVSVVTGHAMNAIGEGPSEHPTSARVDAFAQSNGLGRTGMLRRSKRSAGRAQPRVLRGLALISAATAASLSAVWPSRSVCLGK